MPCGSRTPARKVGELTSARIACSSRYVASGSSSTMSRSHSRWCGSVATVIAPGRSKSQSTAYRFSVSSIASRFSRPSRSSVSISSGHRWTPLACPCVRDAAQNPPLRPDAAHPIRLPSSSRTSRDGSRSLARMAVHSPEKPPPTTQRSAVPFPSYGARGSGRSGWSSQYGVGAASRSASWSTVTGSLSQSQRPPPAPVPGTRRPGSVGAAGPPAVPIPRQPTPASPPACVGTT